MGNGMNGSMSLDEYLPPASSKKNKKQKTAQVKTLKVVRQYLTPETVCSLRVVTVYSDFSIEIGSEKRIIDFDLIEIVAVEK